MECISLERKYTSTILVSLLVSLDPACALTHSFFTNRALLLQKSLQPAHPPPHLHAPAWLLVNKQQLHSSDHFLADGVQQGIADVDAEAQQEFDDFQVLVLDGNQERRAAEWVDAVDVDLEIDFCLLKDKGFFLYLLWDLRISVIRRQTIQRLLCVNTSRHSDLTELLRVYGVQLGERTGTNRHCGTNKQLVSGNILCLQKL